MLLNDEANVFKIQLKRNEGDDKNEVRTLILEGTYRAYFDMGRISTFCNEVLPEELCIVGVN